MNSGAAYQLDRESITLSVPTTITCKFIVDPELVLRWQRFGGRPHKGTPIGLMREFYPFDLLKKQALQEARIFVRYMKQQGNRPQEGESQMLLYGPYRNRMDMSLGSSMENFEEGNHLIPQGMWRSKAHGTWAPDGKGPRLINPEQEYKHGITFYIKGKFLATHGKESEETGTLIVGG